jgi:hypothetical protein
MVTPQSDRHDGRRDRNDDPHNREGQSDPRQPIPLDPFGHSAEGLAQLGRDKARVSQAFHAEIRAAVADRPDEEQRDADDVQQTADARNGL